MIWKMLVIIPLLCLYLHLRSVNPGIQRQEEWTVASEMRAMLENRSFLAVFTLLIPIMDPREIRRWQRRRKGLPEVPMRIHWAWIPTAIVLIPCIIPVYYLGQLYYGVAGSIWVSRDVFLWINKVSLGFYYGSFAVIMMMLLYQYRHRRNKCPVCGYDLTGNVSGKCPECQEPIAHMTNV